MGDVAATVKVMPSSPEVDLDNLETALTSALPDVAEVRGFERENVAFGLIALLTTVVIPDDEGGTEAVEEAFSGVDDVESVEVLNVGLL